MRRTLGTYACLSLAVILVSQSTLTKAEDGTWTLNLGLLEASKKGESALVASRLAEGAAVNTRDRFGNSALIYAVRGNHLETINVLVDAGANLNQANVNGITPLFEAAGGRHIETVRLLLHKGADPNIVNMQQVSPLANAVFNKSAAIVDLLLESGANPDVVDDTGKSSAVYAAANGETQILKRILGVSTALENAVDTRYQHGLTLMMWAAGYGHVDTVKMLVDRGAVLDLADDRGRTAMMIGAENGHGDVVAFLLQSGADADRRDRDGRTARDLASLADQSEILGILN